MVENRVQASDQATAVSVAGLIRELRSGTPDASVSPPVLGREHLELGIDHLVPMHFRKWSAQGLQSSAALATFEEKDAVRSLGQVYEEKCDG